MMVVAVTLGCIPARQPGKQTKVFEHVCCMRERNLIDGSPPHVSINANRKKEKTEKRKEKRRRGKKSYTIRPEHTNSRAPMAIITRRDGRGRDLAHFVYRNRPDDTVDGYAGSTGRGGVGARA